MSREENRAKRLHQASLRISETSAKCGICGFDNPLCLEAHHIAGRAFASEVGAVCRNHHRILSDWQKDHPRQIDHLPTLEEQIVHMMQGAADFLELLVESLRRLADELHKHIAGKGAS